MRSPWGRNKMQLVDKTPRVVYNEAINPIAEALMVVLHSLPAASCLLISLLLAAAARHGVAAQITAFCSLLCAAAVIVMTLMSGSALHEALAYLLLPLFLLLPKERMS